MALITVTDPVTDPITVTGPAITPDRSITTNRPATGAPGDSGTAGTGTCGACGCGARRLADAADAQRRVFGRGLGVLAGVVLGTIIGTAIVNHDGYYRYDDYRDAPQGCYWARKAWRDEDGNVHYGRPRQFCD